MVIEITNQGRAPCITAGRVTQRIELQCHAIVDAQFLQQLICHNEQFYVSGGLGCADYFGIDLVKLPITTLLWAFIAEQWPVH